MQVNAQGASGFLQRFNGQCHVERLLHDGSGPAHNASVRVGVSAIHRHVQCAIDESDDVQNVHIAQRYTQTLRVL